MSSAVTGGSTAHTLVKDQSRVAGFPVPGYTVVRPLGSAVCSERWLAHQPPMNEPAIVYRVSCGSDRAQRERVAAHVDLLRGVCCRHLLPIEDAALGADGDVWVVAPYRGSHDGLLTVGGLSAMHGGQMPLRETIHIGRQVLAGLQSARDHGIVHGEVSAAELLVDRHGSVLIEQCGLRRAMMGGLDSDEAYARESEVRSVAELMYELATGIPSAMLVRDRGMGLRGPLRVLRGWMRAALSSGGGFASPGEAGAALPSV